MPIYLVETYLTFGTAGIRAERERRASTAAGELNRAGTPMCFAGSLYIPADEVCYFAFDAQAGGAAELAARRAGLDALRVVKAVPSGISFGSAGTVSRTRTSRATHPRERRNDS